MGLFGRKPKKTAQELAAEEYVARQLAAEEERRRQARIKAETERQVRRQAEWDAHIQEVRAKCPYRPHHTSEGAFGKIRCRGH